MPVRRCVEPAPSPGPDNVFDVSRVHDEEELKPVGELLPFTPYTPFHLPAG